MDVKPPIYTAIELDSNFNEALHSKGIALHKLGRYAEAIKCYDKVISIKPNTAYGAYNNKGASLAKLKKINEKLVIITFLYFNRIKRLK